MTGGEAALWGLVWVQCYR